MKSNNIKFLFLDVGGVLMTNGWDHQLRARILERFKVEEDEFKVRHDLLFQIFEMGRISMDEYLTRVIFYKKRPYSLEDVKNAIFEAVRPYPEMMDYMKEVRKKHQVKIVIVSNEGRELAIDRMKRFDMCSFVDFFLFSSFVGARKPDAIIYNLAQDVALVNPSQIVYIDDRKFLVEMGSEWGWHTIHHTSIDSTRIQLEALFQYRDQRD